MGAASIEGCEGCDLQDMTEEYTLLSRLDWGWLPQLLMMRQVPATAFLQSTMQVKKNLQISKVLDE